MTRFRPTADPDSLDVLIGDEARRYEEAVNNPGSDSVWSAKAIASLQSHSGRPTRLVVNEDLSSIPLDDLQEILRRAEGGGGW